MIKLRNFTVNVKIGIVLKRRFSSYIVLSATSNLQPLKLLVDDADNSNSWDEVLVEIKRYEGVLRAARTPGAKPSLSPKIFLFSLPEPFFDKCGEEAGRPAKNAEFLF